MTDREKVIKGLQGIFRCVSPLNYTCGDCPYQDNRVGCKRRALNDAITLLKAQEPMKPVVDIDTWKCGNCGHTLENQQLLGDNVLFHEQYNYCPECGKAVKWE